jgi:membrane protein YqaA with SNARE-associated domain
MILILVDIVTNHNVVRATVTQILGGLVDWLLGLIHRR